jgi:hypothetical protein
MPATLTVNTKKFEQAVKQYQRNFPFAVSKAMQTTMQAAQRKVRKEFQQEMHEPRRSTISGVKAQWPNKGQIRSGKFTARVFMVPELANAIHAITFGDTIGLTPQGNGVVVTPVNIRLNRFGNIPRNRLDRMRSNKKRYLEVPLGNRNPRTRHLEPGIYQIFNNQSRDVRTRRRRRVRNLLMMVAYERQRTYRQLIDYHETIERCFESRFFRDLERRVFADKVFRARRGLL